MGRIELREPMKNESEELADYFWRNGQEISGDADVRIWNCDYFAVCTAGPMVCTFLCFKNEILKEIVKVILQ